jgi:hypothetical protein
MRGALAAIAAALALTATQVAAQANFERFAAPPPSEDEVMLQSADELGETRHFCADVPGFGVLSAGLTGWEPRWPLEVHSCKLGLPKSHYFFVDQLVSRSAFADGGRIRFTRFDLCAEVHRTGATPDNVVREDSWVILAPCSDSPRQRFTMAASGEIRSQADGAKCLTIGIEAHEAGNRAPGQPWLQRALTVSSCSPAEAPRQSWRLSAPGPDPS